MMVPAARVAAMPIGEMDSDDVRGECQSIISFFASLGAELTVADAVQDEHAARRAVLGLAAKQPDLLLLVALRGMSARAMEAAAKELNIPSLIWPVNGRFALPSSALAVGAIRESGQPVELVYAPPENPTAMQTARSVLNAARAFTRLRQSRIGVIGGLFPNLVSCRYDAHALQARLGVTIVPVAFDTVRREMERIAPADVSRTRSALSAFSTEEPVDVLPLGPGIRLHLALKRIAAESSIDGFATECWSGLPRELGLNPCLGFVEGTYALACEGDVQLCAGLLALRSLTGADGFVGDLFDLDLRGMLTLVHCGAPASLSPDQGGVRLCRSQVAVERGFQTITCRPDISPGPATLFRLFGPGCDTLHVAQADILRCDSGRDMRLSATLRGDRWAFLDKCHGNHYVVAAGDIRTELGILAGWLGITLNET